MYVKELFKCCTDVVERDFFKKIEINAEKFRAVRALIKTTDKKLTLVQKERELNDEDFTNIFYWE